jgi:hypothetical protein
MIEAFKMCGGLGASGMPGLIYEIYLQDCEKPIKQEIGLPPLFSPILSFAIKPSRKNL